MIANITKRNAVEEERQRVESERRQENRDLMQANQGLTSTLIKVYPHKGVSFFEILQVKFYPLSSVRLSRNFSSCAVAMQYYKKYKIQKFLGEYLSLKFVIYCPSWLKFGMLIALEIDMLGYYKIKVFIC